jgi:hypothetical protein
MPGLSLSLKNRLEMAVHRTIFNPRPSGLNTSTGKNSTRQDILFSPGDQPGSGAWIPFGGLIFSRQWHEKLELSTNLIYTQGTMGSQSENNTRIFI